MKWHGYKKKIRFFFKIIDIILYFEKSFFIQIYCSKRHKHLQFLSIFDDLLKTACLWYRCWQAMSLSGHVTSVKQNKLSISKCIYIIMNDNCWIIKRWSTHKEIWLLTSTECIRIQIKDTGKQKFTQNSTQFTPTTHKEQDFVQMTNARHFSLTLTATLLHIHVPSLYFYSCNTKFIASLRYCTSPAISWSPFLSPFHIFLFGCCLLPSGPAMNNSPFIWKKTEVHLRDSL